jgi:hypothetical protein
MKITNQLRCAFIYLDFKSCLNKFVYPVLRIISLHNGFPRVLRKLTIPIGCTMSTLHSLLSNMCTQPHKQQTIRSAVVELESSDIMESSEANSYKTFLL